MSSSPVFEDRRIPFRFLSLNVDVHIAGVRNKNVHTVQFATSCLLALALDFCLFEGIHKGLGGVIDSHPILVGIALLPLCFIAVCAGGPQLSQAVSVLLGGDDYKQERLELIARRFGGYDIVAIQGCFDAAFFGGDYPEQLRVLAGNHGLVHSAMPPVPAMGVNSGLLILSRFPIAQTTCLDFQHQLNQQLGSFYHNGVLFARIRVPATRGGGSPSSSSGRKTPATVDVNVFSCDVAEEEEGATLLRSLDDRVRGHQLDELFHFIQECTEDNAVGTKVKACVVLAGNLSAGLRHAHAKGGAPPRIEYVRAAVEESVLDPILDAKASRSRLKRAHTWQRMQAAILGRARRRSSSGASDGGRTRRQSLRRMGSSSGVMRTMTGKMVASRAYHRLATKLKKLSRPSSFGAMPGSVVSRRRGTVMLHNWYKHRAQMHIRIKFVDALRRPGAPGADGNAGPSHWPASRGYFADGGGGPAERVLTPAALRRPVTDDLVLVANAGVEGPDAGADKGPGPFAVAVSMALTEAEKNAAGARPAPFTHLSSHWGIAATLLVTPDAYWQEDQDTDTTSDDEDDRSAAGEQNRVKTPTQAALLERARLQSLEMAAEEEYELQREADGEDEDEAGAAAQQDEEERGTESPVAAFDEEGD